MGSTLPGAFCWAVREYLPDCHKVFVKRYLWQSTMSSVPDGSASYFHGPLDKAVHFLPFRGIFRKI